MSLAPINMKDFMASLRRSQKILVDNVGLVINVQKSYETLASKIGKTADELTENQKCQAFFDGLMDHTEKRENYP